MSHHAIDIAIVGAGPAGLATAAACAEAGLHTVCLAPAVGGRWVNNFGAWADRFPYPAAVAERWDAADVLFDEGRAHTLSRPYVRVDNAVLQDLFMSRARAAGAVFVDACARGREQRGSGITLFTDDGDAIDARLAVDASGHAAVLTPRTPASAFQVAWGVDADLDGFEGDPERLVFMDWRRVGPPGPPTFLYVMPLGGDRVFLEETSLASDPPVSFAFLQARLRARLGALGWRIRREHAVERCRIPLDPGLPRVDGAVVPIGGAASMVHPATGYQLARSLDAATRLARAVAADPESPGLAARAWDAVMPPAERRARRLHLYGLAVLLAQGTDATQDFFHAFFQLPPERVRALLTPEASSADLMATMLHMLGAAPWRVRRHLFSPWALARVSGALAFRAPRRPARTPTVRTPAPPV